MPRIARVLLLASAIFTTGCDGSPLGDAQLENVVDTVMLGALVGTPISTPSAFSLSEAQPVRTDISSQFDFAYDVLPDGRHVFIPRDALGLSSNTAGPGLQPTSDAFDDIDEAPLNGYVSLDTITIAAGERYIGRSRVVCAILGVPVYGKLEILSFDDVNRQVTFRVLSNRNCGFRSLRPGIPED